MRLYLLKEEFPISKIYTFLVAENMPNTMGTRNHKSTEGLEDAGGPKLPTPSLFIAR